jgi:hypothetical protein
MYYLVYCLVLIIAVVVVVGPSSVGSDEPLTRAKMVSTGSEWRALLVMALDCSSGDDGTECGDGYFYF